ncbi:MAG: hypothetical protein HY840_12110 [Bacteroidetes bacterium]|nr:hypothetical protein [Bacteroidota bacterium]
MFSSLCEFSTSICLADKFFSENSHSANLQNGTFYTDTEKQFVLQDIIRNIFVRLDENRQCHDIRVEFKLDAVMEEKQFELKADGTYVYNAPKFNNDQFNANFNPQRHVLTKKYEKASFTAGHLSKQIVEPLMKPWQP